MAKCSFCKSRKGKRNCPALGGTVCSQCCGAEKGQGIDCPQDCFYLGKSKQYFAEKLEAQQSANFEQAMKSTIGSEDNHMSLLFRIELAISNAYNKNKALTDRNVEEALEYLMEIGKARLGLPSKFLTEPDQNVKDIIDAVDERLRLKDSQNEDDDVITPLKGIYRVLDSIKTHLNSNDERSYLHFISGFVG